MITSAILIEDVERKLRELGWHKSPIAGKRGESIFEVAKGSEVYLVVLANACFYYHDDKQQAGYRFDSLYEDFPEVKRDNVLFILLGGWGTRKYRGPNVIGINMDSCFIRCRRINPIFAAEKSMLKEYMRERIVVDKFSVYFAFGNYPAEYSTDGMYVLLGLMLAAGIYQLSHWGCATRFAAGANYATGEVYRFITYIFMHAGLWHFIGNFFALKYIGRLYCQRKGILDTLLIFFSSGIFAAYISVMLGGTSSVVGASGAIFGLLGALMADTIFDDAMRGRRKTLIMCGLSTLILSSLGLRVDAYCHVAGFIFGAWGGTLLRIFSDYSDYEEVIRIKEKYNL